MSPITILVVCVQACLIQVAVSQCASNLRSVNLAPAASVVSTVGYGSYGGSGLGEAYVVGDVCASGQTSVVGAVPCEGIASFSGPLAGAGSVAISGQCSCGCE